MSRVRVTYLSATRIMRSLLFPASLAETFSSLGGKNIDQAALSLAMKVSEWPSCTVRICAMQASPSHYFVSETGRDSSKRIMDSGDYLDQVTEQSYASSAIEKVSRFIRISFAFWPQNPQTVKMNTSNVSDETNS